MHHAKLFSTWKGVHDLILLYSFTEESGVITIRKQANIKSSKSEINANYALLSYITKQTLFNVSLSVFMMVI